MLMPGVNRANAEASREMYKKKRRRPQRDKHRGRCSQWVWVADRCREGGCVCVCVAGGVDGFWCVINQQHLPWHCLDSRLRAALLCCALLHLSTIHLFSPSLPLTACLSVCLYTFSFSLRLYRSSSPLLSFLPLSPWLFLLLLLSFLCSLSFSLLIAVAFVFNPFSSTLSLSLCLSISIALILYPPQGFFLQSVVLSIQAALSVGVDY